LITLLLGASTTSCRAAEGLAEFHFDGGMGGVAATTTSGAGGTGGAPSASSAASTGGAASASSSSAASTSASTGAGGALVEDCTNGVDDDGDTLVDCADPACGATGFTCTAPAPAGWIGPFALHEGQDSASTVCPPGYPDLDFDGGAGPMGASATCGACTCSTPAGSCTPLDLQFYKWSNCGASLGKISNVADATCNSLPQSVSSVKATSSFKTPGAACAATGGAATVPPIAWANLVRGCGGAKVGAGCSSGGACAPAPPPGFGAGLCVAQAGVQGCPAGYSHLRSMVTVQDQRGCTSCACASSGGPDCTVQTEVFSDAACQTSVSTIKNAGTCGPTNGGHNAMVSVTLGCSPSGGAPSGSVVESPWTVCCSF
jgi:hypothetical protein